MNQLIYTVSIRISIQVRFAERKNKIFSNIVRQKIVVFSKSFVLEAKNFVPWMLYLADRFSVCQPR